MDTIEILAVIFLLHLLSGVIGAWRMYWGEIKVHYNATNQDIRLTSKELFSKDRFYRVYLTILFYGIFSLIAIELLMPTCWYFRFPKVKEEIDPPDYGTMYN